MGMIKNDISFSLLYKGENDINYSNKAGGSEFDIIFSKRKNEKFRRYILTALESIDNTHPHSIKKLTIKANGETYTCESKNNSDIVNLMSDLYIPITRRICLRRKKNG